MFVLLYRQATSGCDPGKWHDSLRATRTDDLKGLMTPAGVPPVLVIGATGRVGHAVVDLLVGEGVPVRALTRRPEAAATLPAGVEVVTGDLTVPESLDAALRGVGSVFLVWTAPPATLPAVVERLATYARRVVFLSSPHQTPHPFFQQPNPMAVLHADIERFIAASGLESTIIRPGMFASNVAAWWAAAIRADGVVRWPYGAAETAPVDDRDVAAVAARTLCEDGHAEGGYVLTGPESLSQAEQVSIIGDVLRRRIRFEELSPDEFRRETEGSCRARSWTCCSELGAQPSAGRRSSPRRCPTSSVRRDRSASGSPIMPPRSRKVPPHWADLGPGQARGQGRRGVGLEGVRSYR
jgi:uncharacterized protein YbjT (DUF2867 family)